MYFTLIILLYFIYRARFYQQNLYKRREDYNGKWNKCCNKKQSKKRNQMFPNHTYLSLWSITMVFFFSTSQHTYFNYPVLCITKFYIIQHIDILLIISKHMHKTFLEYLQCSHCSKKSSRKINVQFMLGTRLQHLNLPWKGTEIKQSHNEWIKLALSSTSRVSILPGAGWASSHPWATGSLGLFIPPWASGR